MARQPKKDRHPSIDPGYARQEREYVQSIDDLIRRFEDEFLPIMLADSAPSLEDLAPVAMQQGYLLSKIAGYAMLVAANRAVHTDRSYTRRKVRLRSYYHHATGYQDVLRETLEDAFPRPLAEGMERMIAALLIGDFLAEAPAATED